MIEPKIKQHIKLLAERFGHSLSYEGSRILLFNEINAISITSTKKERIEISYNVDQTSPQEAIEVGNETVYDPLIQLLKRAFLHPITLRNSSIIQLSDFLSEERIARKTIPELKHEWLTQQIEYKNLGGNRFEAEFFKGVVILTDDLPDAMLSNVVDVNFDDLNTFFET